MREGMAFVAQEGTEGIYVQAPAGLVAAGLGRDDLLDIETAASPEGLPRMSRSPRRSSKGGPIGIRELEELSFG